MTNLRAAWIPAVQMTNSPTNRGAIDGPITPAHIDVTDADSIRGAVDQITKATDGAGVSGIVSNAAVCAVGPAEQRSRGTA